MNIPIYRAKKIDSDEFIEGWLVKDHLDNSMYLMKLFNEKPDTYEWIKSAITIDPNTLAIHFPNMIDKNGKKIFASLSKDGVGGDRLKISNGYPSCDSERIAKFPQIEYKSFSQNDATTYSYEVIGIHKG